MRCIARSLLVTCALFCLACARGGGPASDAGLPGGGDAATSSLIGLSIAPQGAMLVVDDLAALPQLAMSATGTYTDGSSAPVSASWTVDRFDICGIDASSGLLKAAGAAFGVVKVTATAQGQTATAEVTVKLSLVVDEASAPAADKAKLDAASASDPLVGALRYPYDKTVFPRALLAPELQWSGGANADLYRIRLSADSFELVVYRTAANPSRYSPPQDLWNALGASAKGGPATVELRRLDATSGQAFVSTTQTWTIADANLRGSIYYWAVDHGQIVKLDVSTGTRTLAFDSGPFDLLGAPTPLNAGAPKTPPWESNGGGKRCVACHAVSKDGSRVGGVFTRESSTGPFGSVSLATQAITAISDYTTNMSFSAFTPDGSLAAVNYGDKTIRLIDSATGAGVASTLDGVADLCDPTFSPDGKRFAVAGSCDPGFGYPIEYRRSNLLVYAFNQATRAFTAPITVRTSTGIGDAIAFPSFSPDSNLVFYQRGTYSRAKYGDNANGEFLHGVDDLYVARAEANGAELALDAANGKGVLPADSLHLNYAPTVNPIAEGGYIWVVFTSPRDYGNRMISPQQAAPNDATYANRKQLWVTAVDVSVGSADPSHPAFWLPGQDLSTTNMFGYWALSPCKPTPAAGQAPASCSAGFECCSGFCRDRGGGPACVDAPMGCHQIGEKCTTAADCCTGGGSVDCVAGICQGTIL